MAKIRPWGGTYIVDQWDSSYIPSTNKCNTKCCICGNPAEWIDVFAETGICSETCALTLTKILHEHEEKENYYE